MDRRLQLQQTLETILGTRNVYFQPPEDGKMQYPAIEYHRDYANTQFAGNLPYKHMRRYQLTVMDYEADSEILAKIEKLPMCLFQRHFASDNLNHDIYILYF